MNELVWLSDRLLQSMVQEGGNKSPLETGGIILGYRADTGETVITDIVYAGPKAKHRRFGFVPDHEYQVAQIDARYQESGGITTYLGDWHTHPHSSNVMSWRDRRTLQRIAKTPSARTPAPLMAILGSNGLAVWRHSASSLLGSVAVCLPVRIY